MTSKIIPYNNILPNIHNSAYIAEGVYVIGNVIIEEHSSIWFNSVVRADVDFIRIGKRTNIQDGTVIHVSRNNGPAIIGNHVTIGHHATIHATTIEDYAFIGMNAVVMDNSIIKTFGFVAAGALISPRKIVESYQLWAGIPAKFVRNITKDEIAMIKESSMHYVNLAKQYKYLQ